MFELCIYPLVILLLAVSLCQLASAQPADHDDVLRREIDAVLAVPDKARLRELVKDEASETLPVLAGLNRWMQIKQRVQTQTIEKTELQKALMVAAIYGHHKVVFYLTSACYGKLDPNYYGPTGFFEDCTPLHQAAARGHLETVEKLVLCGAEMDAKDHKHHATPRDWAAKADKQQVVELLDQMQQYMPIVFAARQGDLAKLGELLDANPQWLDTPIPNGATMLMDLCNINTPLKNVGKTIAYLIKRGANPNQTLNRDGTGETPLHWAASFGPNIKHGPEAINALLDHGANIDATGSVLGNGTPLVNAVIFRDLDSAKLLIERGAKFDMALAAGVGRLDLVKSFFDDSGKFHNPYGNMPHRDSTSDPQGEMNMAIMLAGMHGHRACIAWLLEKGAQINTVSIVKTTCLDELINHGYEQTANWLRQQGALTYKQLQEQEAGNE